MRNLIISKYKYKIIIMQVPNSGRSRRNSQPYVSRDECTHTHFYLTERGTHQAKRNQSSNIWEAFGCYGSGDGYAMCYAVDSYRSTRATLLSSDNQDKQRKNKLQLQRLQKQKQNYQLKLQQQQLSKSLQKSGKRKNVSFALKQQLNQSSINNKDLIIQTNFNRNQKNSSEVQNSFQRSRNSSLNIKQKYKRQRVSGNQGQNKVNINQFLTKKLTKQQQQKRQLFLKQCYSIDKYLQSNKANTRTMPNSAIKLFYQRPCIQAYGRKNTKGNNGFIYNDFMKTHNVLPHRLENEPKKYQTYRSALNFCKRTKIDPEERWRKIHRQMKKRLDMKELVQYYAQGVIDVTTDNIQQILKLNINSIKGTQFKRSRSLGNLLYLPNSENLNVTIKSSGKSDLNTTKATNDPKQQSSDRINSLKRSKSWGKKQHLFLYKYTGKDGKTHFCKDRHGITCYVDPTFEQNKQAYTNFLKRVHPLQAEDVDPSDRNLDQLLVQNFVESKQDDSIAKHYLLPNCDQPYRPQKYSIKSRKKSMIATASTQKQ